MTCNGERFHALCLKSCLTFKDNGTEYCGGPNRLNVYQKNGTYTPPTSIVSTSTGSTAAPGGSAPTSTGGPQLKQTVSNYVFQGCYTEATNGRALSTKTYANDSMTLESCAAFCFPNSMFGVEYGRECYCGNKLSVGSVYATDQGDCSFLCPGDNTEYCGVRLPCSSFFSVLCLPIHRLVIDLSFMH